VFDPGYTASLHSEVVRTIAERGHEVGHHGHMHERPDTLSDADERRVLERGIDTLERIVGSPPTAYRSPAGELKPTTPDLLLEYGFRYDSSLMGFDHPYYVSTGRGELLEIPWHWDNDDWPLFGFVSVPPVGNGIAAPSTALELWSEAFAEIYARGGHFSLVMHPFLTGRPAQLRVLEKLIRFVRGFPKVWWASLSEVADHCAGPATAARLPRVGATIPPPDWVDEATTVAQS
jgi:peptidoglycan/xylan/chitin deacetylase (PgdA/CDA1 family)